MTLFYLIHTDNQLLIAIPNNFIFFINFPIKLLIDLLMSNDENYKNIFMVH